LPNELEQLKKYMIFQNKSKTFIVKPEQECAGIGVHLIQNYQLVAHYSKKQQTVEIDLEIFFQLWVFEYFLEFYGVKYLKY
jgi:hypothetical protein